MIETEAFAGLFTLEDEELNLPCELKSDDNMFPGGVFHTEKADWVVRRECTSCGRSVKMYCDGHLQAQRRGEKTAGGVFHIACGTATTLTVVSAVRISKD
jgi:hypothetical protein